MSTLATWAAVATLAAGHAAGQGEPSAESADRADPTSALEEPRSEWARHRASTEEPWTESVPPQAEVIPTPPPTPPPSFHPLRVRWGITSPVLVTTGLGFGLMEAIGGAGDAPVVCTPPRDGTCPDLGPLEFIDRVALGHYNPGASTASDLLVGAALLGSLVVSMAESIAWAQGERDAGVKRYRRRGAGRFGYDTAIWAESVGVAIFTTNVLKEAFGRARPLTHLGEDALVEAGLPPEDLDGGFARSFPSGHATLAFSSVVAGATLLTLKQCRPTLERRRSGMPRCATRTPKQRAMLGLMWGLGLAGASTVAVLRVVAGKHYPTDVLMGAAIGASSGVAIPLLHRHW